MALQAYREVLAPLSAAFPDYLPPATYDEVDGRVVIGVQCWAGLVGAGRHTRAWLCIANDVEIEWRLSGLL